VFNHLQDNDTADELTHHLSRSSTRRPLAPVAQEVQHHEELLLVMITGMVKDFVREREARRKARKSS